MNIVGVSLEGSIREYFSLGQLASEIAVSAIVFALAIVVGWVAYSIFKRYLTRWAEKTKTKLDDEILRNIKAPILFLAILVGAYYGLNLLTFLEQYSEILTAVFTVAEILVVTLVIV